MTDINNGISIEVESLSTPQVQEQPKRVDTLADFQDEPNKNTEISLSDNQRKIIMDMWNDAKKNNKNPPSLPELASAAFQRTIEPRSVEMNAVKKFISTQKATSAPQVKKPPYELSPEQKAYIDNNAFTMSAYEISRILFKNPNISNLSSEARAVTQYHKEITAGKSLNGINAEEDYSPPTRLNQVVARIRKYIPLTEMNSEQLSAREKQNCSALMAYLHTLRFVRQIQSFVDELDRDLFESQFIRCCFDKSDLTPEEVDQYIIYSNEVVISKNILESINKLQRELDDILDSEDSDGRKLSVPLVDAIKTMRDEYNQSVKRQQDLLKDLKVKRSERLSKQGKDKISITDLVQAWKDQEFREKTIHLAKKRQEVLKTEVKNLSDMDELKARIFGLSENEVLNG